MPPLPEWLAWAPTLDRIYQEELFRSCYSDPEAFVNWTFHWREHGSTEASIRAAIQGSPEWKDKHPGQDPITPPPPDPHPDPHPIPGDLPVGIPSGRGPFRLSGFETRLFRITTPEDGIVRPVGMSYWPNINNHSGRPNFYVLTSLNDYLTIFSVDKASGQVSLLQRTTLHHTGEGSYWSFTEPDVFYTFFPDRLMRCNVSGSQETLFTTPGTIKQPHSSADGRVHSFTMDGVAAVFRNGEIKTFAPNGPYDECQIGKEGRFLLSKEGADNRIFDLDRGTEHFITDRDGAAGHSDMGYGCVVGEDDQTDPGGCFRFWTFSDSGPVKGDTLYCTGDWSPSTRYVSFCNAKPGSPAGQRLLFCSAEIGLVLLINGQPRHICPALTDMNASGGASEGNYWKKPRANMCPPGQYAAFSGNHGSDRLDIFVAELPR